ncbi:MULTISPECIES: hypothetical protein, partial [unclassified Rhizobium]|uniref:hypothetical protein n=1 Tax=unclassified Rhizobium TaxID=2613769 RepID=UPI001AEF360E
HAKARCPCKRTPAKTAKMDTKTRLIETDTLVSDIWSVPFVAMSPAVTHGESLKSLSTATWDLCGDPNETRPASHIVPPVIPRSGQFRDRRMTPRPSSLTSFAVSTFG